MPSSKWLKPVPSSDVSVGSTEASPSTSNISMSDLRRIQDEKRKREEIDSEGIPSTGIPLEGSPSESIPVDGIPSTGILSMEMPRRNLPKSKQQPLTLKTKLKIDATAERGYYPTFNDLDDRIIPSFRLDTFEQSILRRLYRLSRGFRSQECEAGLGALSKACNMSRSQAQKTINSLLTKGLIHSLGHSQAGTRYSVLKELPAIPLKGIPQEGIPQDAAGIPQVKAYGIPRGGNNKNNKDLIKTHTQTQEEPAAVVCVGSKFSLEDCRRYATHLQQSGQGITNPGGYATTIHRTGEADAFIQAFLHPAAAAPVPDATQCPDCRGSGFFYPLGPDKGVAKCRHTRLTKEVE